MLVSAMQELEKTKAEFSQDDTFTVAELEAEAEFWWSAYDCELCDKQMCSWHYGWFVGR